MRNFLLLLTLLATQSVFAQNYRVSIATYVNKQKPIAISEAGITGVFRKVDQNKLYHYYIGDFSTEEEAEEARLALLMKGFVDARVIDLEEQKLYCGSPCPYFMDDYIYNHIGSDGLMVGSIFFLDGGYQVSREASKTAYEFAKILKKNPDFSVHLSGHSDASGSALDNIYLAKQRLKAVKIRLLNAGVRSRIISGTVFGEGMPLGGHRKYDRRVVLSILDSSGQVVSRNRATIRRGRSTTRRK